jgi:exopolysaccharide biosynthesis polyprenyl glycosylphosphotransferase
VTIASPRQLHLPDTEALTATPEVGGPGTATRLTGRRTGRRRYIDSPRALIEDYRRIAIVADAVAGSLGAVGASLARFSTDVDASYVLISLLVPLGWLTIVTAQRGYEPRFLGAGPEEYRRILHSGVLLFTALAVLAFIFATELSRGYVAVVVPGTVLLTLLARHVLRHWVFSLRADGVGLQRVLVVGRADATVAVIEKFDHEPQHGLVAVGACVPPVGVDVARIRGVPVVGDPSQILDAVDQTGAHVVAVVSHPDLSGQALRRLSWALEERDVELVVSPGIIEVAGPRLSIRPVAGLSLLHLERPSGSGGKMLMKAAFDRTCGVLLLLLALPLLAVIAAAVRLTSSGPVFFRQTRIGVGSREFTMLKFRSMVADAEQLRERLRQHDDDGNGMLFKMHRDPRVTRVGALLRRFSLDELPQIVNVVLGEMSLVGPRPPLPEEVASYNADAVRRLRVRPGITGLWQVSGRSDLSWEESLRLDLRYVDNWSIALDVSILWRTCRAVLRGAGAY